MPVCSSASPQPRPPLCLAPKGPESLLVIQLARLGDFLQTTPLLAALRAQHPQARLAVAVAPAVAPLARACRQVDQVLTLDPATLENAAAGQTHLALARLAGLCQPLWDEPVQEVYNLNLSQAAAGLAAGWPGARLRGWRPQARGSALRGEAWTPFIMGLLSDRRLTRLHLCDILASYSPPAAPPLGRLEHRIDPAAQQAAQALLPAGRPRVALQLGANHDLRRWPLESFAALAQGLAAQGASLILTGSSREKRLAQRLARLLPQPAPPLIDLLGRTDLPTLAAVLAQCDLVVSADTGTLHLATAVGATVLALYMGPAQAHETGPYGAGHLVLQARDHCGPCLEQRPTCQGQAPCRRLIAPGAALTAATRLLAGAVAGLELPPGVEPLVGLLDGFGQRYRPLRPRPLTLLEGLALALRQAGRALLRPGQEVADCQAELAGEHLPPAGEQAVALAGLAASARRLARAAAQCDLAAARGLLISAPSLAPLARLVGEDPPPGLQEACQAAAATLSQAAGG